MIKDYNQISPNLERDIINKIEFIKRRNLIIKQRIFSIVSVVSLFFLVISIKSIFENIGISGVYNYISLLVSDSNVLPYWKELTYSVLESLPFLGLTLAFGLTALFLWSILKTINLTKKYEIKYI